MSLKRIKSANKRFKYPVFGYIRDHEENKSINIPMRIKYTCLNYYLLTENFANHGNKITLNETKNIMTGNFNDTERKINTVYGDISISNKDKSIQEYAWKFQIMNTDQNKHYFISFGIDSSNQKWTNGPFDDSVYNLDPFYSWRINFSAKRVSKCCKYLLGSYEVKRNWNFEFNENKWYGFEVILSTKTNTLKFTFKDEDLEDIHQNINFKETSYRMAISTGTNIKVKLLDFVVSQ